MAGKQRSSSESQRTAYSVQVLDRAIAILTTLGRNPSGMGLGELSGALALHKSTVHRLLMALEQHRFVEKSENNGKHCLGLKLFELGSAAISRIDIRAIAYPYLERLVFESGETAHLCILDRGEVLYLEKVEPSRTVRMPTNVGQRNPAHCTAVGKAILAFLPDQKVDEIIVSSDLKRFTPQTLTTPAALKRELARVRKQGVAIDNEEIEEGLKCIGAPVRDYSGEVVASISIAGPSFRMTREQISLLSGVVRRISGELSARLGFRAPGERGK